MLFPLQKSFRTKMLAVHMVFVLLVTSQHILSEAFSSSESPCERAVYGGGVNDNSATPQTSYEEAAQNSKYPSYWWKLRCDVGVQLLFHMADLFFTPFLLLYTLLPVINPFMRVCEKVFSQ